MFSNITHLICGKNFDENDVNQATDLCEVPSVNENWIIASARLGRLTCTKPYDPMPNGLFSKIVGTIVQLSAVDRKRLFALITFNGGKVERDFSAQTTHLICGTANGNAYKRAIELNSDKLAVVTPDWIFECLKAQELVETNIYHPKLLTEVSTATAATVTMQQQQQKSTTMPSSAVLSRNHSIENDNRTLSNILGMDCEEKKPLSKELGADAVNEIISKSTESMSLNVKSGGEKNKLFENSVPTQAKLNDANVAQTNMPVQSIGPDLQQKMSIQSQQFTNQMTTMVGHQQSQSVPVSGAFAFVQDEQQSGCKRDASEMQTRGKNDSSVTTMHPACVSLPPRLHNTGMPITSRLHAGETIGPNRNPYETIKPPVQLLERSLSEGQQQIHQQPMTPAPTLNNSNNSR